MIPVFDKTAPFIWSAYGATIAALILLVAGCLIVASRARARLARLEAMEKERQS